MSIPSRPLLNTWLSAVGGRGGSIAHFPGVWAHWLKMAAISPLVQVREVKELGNRSATVGQLGDRSCGSARLIRRFPPRCYSAASFSRPSACRGGLPELLGQGLFKVGVTVGDRMAGSFPGSGPA